LEVFGHWLNNNISLFFFLFDFVNFSVRSVWTDVLISGSILLFHSQNICNRRL